ncbi:MAG: hypothetical protein IPK97_17540 [Ahniella sp.]|nr:hypothetical protein [Ahniella sp.]
MSTFLTLLKREYWENRGGFLWAPIIVISLFTVFTLIGMIAGKVHLGNLPVEMRSLPLDQMIAKLSPEQLQKAMIGWRHALAGFGLIVQMVLGVVLFFYLLSSLHDDRKDRSILFWKSMPVSDFSTLLSKYVSAALVAPLFAWVGVIVLQLIMLVMFSIFFLSNGVQKYTLLWTEADLIGMWIRMFVGIPLNALWALPAYGWLMMVSSWSRSRPFLWAVFAPIGVGLVLTWIDVLSNLQIPQSWYWINMFGRAILGVVPWMFGDGANAIGFNFSSDRGPYDLYSWEAMGSLLGSAHLWIGVVAGLAMLGVAFYFRRYREIAD